MMLSTRRIALVIVTLATGVPEAQDRPRPIEEEAKRHVGNIATLCGTVVAYQCQRPERTSLLALEKSFSASGVSVAIAREDRSKFGTLFEQRHVFLKVCATGPVEKRKNRYVISIKEPGQLRLEGNPLPSVTFGAETLSACDDGVELPKLVHEVKPEYTQAAWNARIEGVVLLEAVVLTDGQVGDIRLLRSLDPTLGLDEQAMKALKSWRFAAGTFQGRPVPVVITVELSFRRR
jgi:TonB family protein